MGLQKSLLSDYIGITKQLIGLQKITVGLHLGLQKKTVGLHSGLQKKNVGIIIPTVDQLGISAALPVWGDYLWGY